MEDHSLALLTDLYQLTMAYGYWKEGIHEKKSCYYHFFRKKPFGGEYAVCAGLASLISFIESFSFSSSDLSYLQSLKGIDNKPLFSNEFLQYLSKFSFQLDIDAAEEGSVVFPNEPLVRVRGPILHAQLLESPLLNIINFQTLIATKASRICQVASPGEVVEFGMRRAQGVDGAVTAARAAYVGGCSSTSNVLAGKLFNIPVRGTQAHSWIMCYEEEKEAFEVFAKHMSGNSVFLVDTYNTIEGTKKAIVVAKKMIAQGKRPIGVRLDSGDLAQLSVKVRQLLDEAGLQDMKIMASNELDEEIIQDLVHQGAKIDIWGVGTSLVTAKGQPALDGVYKLSMVQEEGTWKPRLKVSDQVIKTTTPGMLQVKRFYQGAKAVADMIYDEHTAINPSHTIVDPYDPHKVSTIQQDLKEEKLLKPIFRSGNKIYSEPTLKAIQEKTMEQLASFDPTMRRLLNPSPYPTGLDKNLYQLKLSLIEKAKRDS